MKKWKFYEIKEISDVDFKAKEWRNKRIKSLKNFNQTG